MISVHTQAENTWYVDASRPDDNGPGDAPETAWQIIQTAIDNAEEGDLILVAPGIYDQGGRIGPYTGAVVTNRVLIDKALTLQAISTNPADTSIVGAPDPDTGSIGPLAVRSVFMAADSTLIGFTVTNGYTLNAGISDRRYGDGAGILAANTSAVVSNCIIRNNYASHRAGGVYSGTLYDCVIEDNATVGGGGHGGGGGAFGSVLHRCVIERNTAIQTGGGARSATLYNCEINFNHGSGYAGALDISTAYDCTIGHNTGGSHGAISRDNILIRCVIYGTDGYASGHNTIDRASYFESCIIFGIRGRYSSPMLNSGTYVNCLFYDIDTHNSSSPLIGGSATVINCTIVSNNARGGAIDSGSATVINSIIYYNYGSGGDITAATTNVSYSCASDISHLTTPGNTDAEPLFVNIASNDFNLMRLSPCVDTGTAVLDPHTGLALTNDLAGTERPLDGTGDGQALYDMGAYEYILPPTGIIFFSE